MSKNESFQTAKAYEDTLMIPTYNLKKENRNPCFDYQYGIAYIYPYPLLDDFGTEAQEKHFRALHIENRYLKVTVLPELGGRVYSVFDKMSKREVFYKNTIIKFAPLAIRGAFFSGGIEINFPVGHNVTTTEPVNWELRENEDGSASLSYGALEHISRMRWIVTLTLYPDRCALAQDVQIQNPSNLPGRYFYWCTPACEANEQTEFIYPFKRCRSYMWDGEVSWPNVRVDLTPLGGKLETYVGVPTWPSKQLHKPIDIHWEKNIINQVSIFGSHPEEDYYGVWQHSGDYGYAHFSDHHDIAGMKHWSWGNSGMSLMTQTSLTDDGSRYAETQCGLMENQHDFDFLLPNTTRRWREWWLPIRGIGGLTCASAELAACIRISKSQQPNHADLSIAICSVRVHKKISVIISSNSKNLLEKSRAIKPEEPWRITETIRTVAIANYPVKLTILDENGIEILSYTQKREVDVKNTPEFTEIVKQDTAEDYFQLGLAHEKLEHREEAMKSYQNALSIDNRHGLSHLHLGLMHYRAAHFQLAADHVKQAVEAGVMEANYYLGNLMLIEGKLQVAVLYFRAVPTNTPFSSSALCSLGAISLRRLDFHKASQFLKAAMLEDGNSSTASLLYAISLRLLDKKDEAHLQLLEVIQKDPLNHVAYRELMLVAPNQAKSLQYRTKLTQLLADDCQFVIDLACFYIRAGLVDDARSILIEGFEEWNYPMLAYLLYDLFKEMGNVSEAEEWLDKASRGDPDFVFPSRLEEIEVLRRVIQEKPEDHKAKYYLGNFLYAHQRFEEAIQLWEAAVEGMESFDVLYRNLGLAYWNRSNDSSRAIYCFEKAIELNSLNQDLYIHLDDLYKAQKLVGKRQALLEKVRQLSEPRHDVQKRMITMLVELDCYEEAIRKLNSEIFMPLEMDQSFRHSYVRAFIKRAEASLKSGRAEEAIKDYKKAMEYPSNVGVGKPVVGTNAEILYLLGCTYETIGQIDEAIASWRESAGEIHIQGSDLYPFIQKSLDKLNVYSELGYC